MRYLCISLLALSACGLTPPATSIVSPPAAVADATTMDEQAALSVELAYQAATTAVLATGLAKAPAVKAADRRAYAAVLAVRAAYDAGNATDYLTATKAARAAVSGLLTAIKG